MADSSEVSNVDLVEGAETETHIVIDGNWDHEMANEEEDQAEIHVEAVNSPQDTETEEITGMTEVENEFHLEAYNKDDNDESIADNQEHVQEVFFDESDEESEDDYDTLNLKNPDMLVNILGKKMTTDDIAFAADMKLKMKDFFKKCSPDLSFNTLVQLFVQKIPQQNPTYVLSHDERPGTVLALHKYAILCSAMGCSNAYYRDGSDWEQIEQKKNFFGFPPNQDKCKEWIQSLGRLKYLNKTLNEMQMYRVCEDHFTPDDFTNEYREELLESAVPSLFLGRFEDTAFENFEE